MVQSIPDRTKQGVGHAMSSATNRASSGHQNIGSPTWMDSSTRQSGKISWVQDVSELERWLRELKHGLDGELSHGLQEVR